MKGDPFYGPRGQVRALFERQRRLVRKDGALDAQGRPFYEGRFAGVAHDLLAGMVPPQRAFVLDPARNIAATNNRQCGKTFCIGRRGLRSCLLNPRWQSVYVYETFAQAKDILWKDPNDGLPAVLARTALVRGQDYSLNNSSFTVTFSNGSLVQLVGLDGEGWHKLRGRKLNELFVDEAQKSMDLAGAYGFIRPTLTTHDGTFVMTGTPNEFCVGLLHDVTNPELPAEKRAGWSVHRWTASDLVGLPGKPGQIWPNALRDRAAGMYDDATWRREWLGEWVRGGLGSMFGHARQPLFAWEGGPLPASFVGPDGAVHPFDFGWRHVVGLDIGYDPDPFAWVVLAYSRHHPAVFEVESGKRTRLSTDEQAGVIAGLRERYATEELVVDAGALGKQIANDFRVRHGLPVAAAEKHDKARNIETLDADVVGGRFRATKGSALFDELVDARWDQRAWSQGRKEVDPRCQDHCLDAALYAYRRCFHFLADAPRAPETPRQRDERRVAEERRRALHRRPQPVRGYGPGRAWR